MSVLDTLRAGKARIEEMGWCQGDDAVFVANEAKGCCVATSMCRHSQAMDAVHVFKRANGIPDAIDGEHISIGDWNDAPGRTLEEVLAAFDKAITLAEQENL